jgi:hypothetical protein
LIEVVKGGCRLRNGEHTAESTQAETETTPRSLREAEAESVALLCCEALGLPGAEECRG